MRRRGVVGGEQAIKQRDRNHRGSRREGARYTKIQYQETNRIQEISSGVHIPHRLLAQSSSSWRDVISNRVLTSVRERGLLYAGGRPMVGRVGLRRSASFSLVFLSRSRCSSLRYLLPDGDRFLDPQRALGASVCVAREESGGESEMRMIFRGFFGGR